MLHPTIPEKVVKSFSARDIVNGKTSTSMRSGEKLHHASQGLPPYANGLVAEELNESPNSQGGNHCRIIRYTHKV